MSPQSPPDGQWSLTVLYLMSLVLDYHMGRPLGTLAWEAFHDDHL